MLQMNEEQLEEASSIKYLGEVISVDESSKGRNRSKDYTGKSRHDKAKLYMGDQHQFHSNKEQ